MIAVLCRYFGLKNIEIAEDIVSETFLKASENWPINGIPENPTAWLYTVANNKAKDYLKHVSIFENQVRNAIKEDEILKEQDFDFTHQNIADSQLAMIFAVCNPSNSKQAQISLALQVLCSFSIEEIASAFLTKTETIKKYLQRARANLRNNSFQIRKLPEADIKSRLDTVLKTLYLLFNEGYFSKTNNQLIRKELCSDAVRLMLILTENPLTDTPQTNALLALMCFQSSRLDARTDDSGKMILFEEQDRSLWNNDLIERGNYYLVKAFSGNEISKYHLEAGIAYWHTITTDKNKWEQVLQLYNQLIIIEYSPITALNRIFAFAKVYGNEKAIHEAKKLNLTKNSYYHKLLGYLYEEVNIDEAIAHYNTTISLTKSKTEKQNLAKEVERLKHRKLGR
ncbi:MAG: RNA polymerase subunit sigma [Bacteroidales bacterium]|nr:RNA polymerase subunit sigma [Bacteroidales bacterium]